MNSNLIDFGSRLRFLLESLWDLHEQLKEYNTFLYVIKGHPLASLEKVCEEWNVTRLVFQADRELRSRIVEDKIEKLASTMNIEVHNNAPLIIRYICHI